MHSVNFLALWLWLLILLPWLERHYLLCLGVLSLSLACYFARAKLLRSLPRLKWLVLSILLVYGWTTPGQYLWLAWFSPTDTGLLLGIEQVTRLVIVTSSIQVLLTHMTRSEIFTSIYLLLSPFQYINRMQARFALRFALTLEKTEALLESRVDFKTLLGMILRPTAHYDAEFVFEYIPMNFWQQCVLVVQCTLIVLVLLMGVSGFWN